MPYLASTLLRVIPCPAPTLLRVLCLRCSYTPRSNVLPRSYTPKKIPTERRGIYELLLHKGDEELLELFHTAA
eukprot:74287-Prorocentrum_minimum.AAC.1